MIHIFCVRILCLLLSCYYCYYYLLLETQVLTYGLNLFAKKWTYIQVRLNYYKL